MLDTLLKKLEDIVDAAEQQWLDYAEWAIGIRDGEQAFVFTMVCLLLVTSALLSAIMVWRKPRTWLERSLLWREVAKSGLWVALIYATHYQETIATGPRITIYASVFVTSALVVILAIKESIPHPDDIENKYAQRVVRLFQRNKSTVHETY